MLTPRQEKCLKLMAEGNLTQKDIATHIKVSEQTICNWKKSDEFMSEYDRLLKINIRSLGARAYKKQTELLNAKSEMVRYLVTKDILDRAGFKPEEKLNVSGAGTVTIIDDLKE